MEVSSNSMKVARVTVRAMTQGLMTGRALGLVAGFDCEGGAARPGSISSTAASCSSVNTAWLAKMAVSFSSREIGSCGGDRQEFIYDDRPLY